jgi:ribonuclease-3
MRERGPLVGSANAITVSMGCNTEETFGAALETEPQPRVDEWARGSIADAPERVRVLEARLGLRFSTPRLAAQALLHRSVVLEQERAGSVLDWLPSNERLEFLGDAVLNAMAARMVFDRFPTWDEGRLTEARSALVRRAVFARLAEDLGLGDLVYMGSAELRGDGRGRATVLGEALEAVMGAVYLDHGWETANRVAYGLLEPLFASLEDAIGQDNAKAQLQVLSQARFAGLPEYVLIERRGPDHAGSFRVEARAGGKQAVGEGTSRKRAEQAAARALLRQLVEKSAPEQDDPTGTGEPAMETV